MRRGWEGAVLKALRAKDFTLTVVAAEQPHPHLITLRVDGGPLLTDCGYHPTMWLRLWFERDGRGHQRGYTVVDPDRDSGRFTLEFAVHDGPAVDWARAAAPGDTLPATLYGSSFDAPTEIRRVWAVGDAASLPAVNGLLDALDAPATVWLEYAHDDERDLPVRSREGDTVHWVARDGDALVEAVRSGLAGADPVPGEDWFWVAAEASATRTLARHLRREVGVGKERLSSLAYWRATA